MTNFNFNKIKAVGCAAALALFSLSAPASAEADKVSGSASYSFNSHFVSYGLDVWGGGDDFYGSQATSFLSTDMTIDLSPISLNMGVWSDVNDNVVSGIGGKIQEVDVWVGLSADVGRFNLGVTYQQWYYAGDNEGIVDLKIAFDDSDLLPISLSPSLTWHFRVDGNGAQEKSSAIVLAISPSFTLVNDDTYPVTLSIPAGVAFFVDKDFQGGDKSGVGYFYIGASLGVPLAFIDPAYGDWSMNFDVTYYNSSPRAIPGNVEDDFFTGSVGIAVGF
jgi:hypothetical protein